MVWPLAQRPWWLMCSKTTVFFSMLCLYMPSCRWLDMLRSHRDPPPFRTMRSGPTAVAVSVPVLLSSPGQVQPQLLWSVGARAGRCLQMAASQYRV
jgi:hypothetical protein